jgi:hypothetical protein
MGGLKLAGGLWIIAGLSCVVLVFFTLGEPIMALFIGGAFVGLSIGALLFVRPGRGALRRSNVGGLVWLVAFGAYTLIELDQQYLSTAVWLLAVGGAGALVAYWRRAAVAPIT